MERSQPDGKGPELRVLVTGGAGFIGSTLVDRLLQEGFLVDAIDDLSTGSLQNLSNAKLHDHFHFFHLDMRNPKIVDLVSERKPQVIYHLAAQASVARSVKEPWIDADINILGTIRVLDAARAAGTRKVVFAASGGTLYGSPDRKSLPLSELHPQSPDSPYGISKRAALDYLRSYSELFEIEYSALALANVYGPRQDPFGEAGVVATFSMNLVQDLPSTINGDGDQTRDFVFVEDVVNAFILASTKGDGLLLNIGTGVETSINDLYTTMLDAHGGGPLAERGPARAGEVRFSSLDPSLANEKLGWRAAVSLRDGLVAVLDSAEKRLSNGASSLD